MASVNDISQATNSMYSTASSTQKSNVETSQETKDSSSSSTGINSSTASSVNDNSMLDKDAFLKLLLIEMQHQDPTDPMDSEKMLSQTSQLAALEMQQNTNTTMEKMVETMNVLSESMLATGNLSVLNAIGRTAIIADTNIKFTGAALDIKMHLPKESKDGATFQVLDSKGKIIKDIKVAKEDLTVGTNTIKWDGRDNDGNAVANGNYTMKVSYADIDGGTTTSAYGAYPIESIRFSNGIPEILIAGQYVKFEEIKELS